VIHRTLAPLVLLCSASCAGSLPSDQLDRAIPLPEPGLWEVTPERAGPTPTYLINASRLISIAFHHNPEIRSSFERFQVEKASYDFFVASNDALTLGMRTSTSYNRSKTDPDFVGTTVDRSRENTIEATVEKDFFDTTELDARAGFRRFEFNDDGGYHPFVATDLRYPLGPSRGRLLRTSEDIFRQNELIDAQLDYINEVREQLEDALTQYYRVIELRAQVLINQAWVDDLEALRAQAKEAASSDLSRIEAEQTRAVARHRESTGRYQIELARLISVSGLEFESEFDVVEEDFNPFADASHQFVRDEAADTDPEIATLRNSLRNAEVQLDLARQGKWDIALLLGASADLEGKGTDDDTSAYGVALGLEVSHVDPRVTGSLERQALASIARFRKAITARQREIWVNTLEPMVRIETLSQNEVELIDNLTRFEKDYVEGIALYENGTLNIDDLLRRRATLYRQEEDIAELSNIIGVNVAELMTATGKYFEMLDADAGADDEPRETLKAPP